MLDLNIEIKKYVIKRQTEEQYQGGLIGLEVVRKIFETYPSSENISDILLKVAVLNDLYHTHLTAPFKMAKHIFSFKDLDFLISQGSPKAVLQIASLSFKNTSPEDVYIFATKYCFMTNPKDYFIYDPIVHKELVKYLNLSENEALKLKDYACFSARMNELIQKYQITASHTDLDTFLWLSGHENLTGV